MKGDLHLLGAALLERLILRRVDSRRFVGADVRALRNETDGDCSANHLHSLAQRAAQKTIVSCISSTKNG